MPRNSLRNTFTQAFPPKPTFTEKDLPDLNGKVYIVTGANTGTGKELTRLLYSKNAKVYMAARSEEKTAAAIADIQGTCPGSAGALVFLQLDLADLSTIKATVGRFLALETRLHVLFNNAGVMATSRQVETTAQGHELHIGVNCLGTFLLTQLLTPVLAATATEEPKGTVRVIWVASSATEAFAEERVGIRPEATSPESLGSKSYMMRYWLSKVGNWAHAAEYARRQRDSGVVSVALNPGNLNSDLYREHGLALKLVARLLMYPPLSGAYTELFAGLSPDITIEKTGCWVVPFGRIFPIRSDLDYAVKTEAEGGTGGTLKFWEWSEEQVKPYI